LNSDTTGKVDRFQGRRVAVLVLAVIACGAAARCSDEGAQANVTSSPFFGTWKLDVAKSTFGPGQALRVQIRTYEPSGDGQKGSVESIDAEGHRAKYGYAARFDGRYYPMTGSGIPGGADAIRLMRPDANTIEATLRKAETVVMRAALTVSRDGQLLTIRRTGQVHAVLVFNKE
jgi:hypothetical protein